MLIFVQIKSSTFSFYFWKKSIKKKIKMLKNFQMFNFSLKIHIFDWIKIFENFLFLRKCLIFSFFFRRKCWKIIFFLSFFEEMFGFSEKIFAFFYENYHFSAKMFENFPKCSRISKKCSRICGKCSRIWRNVEVFL